MNFIKAVTEGKYIRRGVWENKYIYVRKEDMVWNDNQPVFIDGQSFSNIDILLDDWEIMELFRDDDIKVVGGDKFKIIKK